METDLRWSRHNRSSSSLNHPASARLHFAHSGRTSIVTLRTIQSLEWVRLRWSSSAARCALLIPEVTAQVLQDLGHVPLNRRLLDAPDLAQQALDIWPEPRWPSTADLLEGIARPHADKLL